MSIDKKLLETSKKAKEKAYKRRNEEFINFFLAPNFSYMYKYISEYSKCKTYEDSILWQDYLVKRFLIDCKLDMTIKKSQRTRDFFVSHKISSNDNDKREDVQCRKLCGDTNCILNILDYQIPLKAHADNRGKEQMKEINDGLGKIDLIGKCDNGKLNIIEYKTPKSNEPLLRAAMEIFTYYHNVKDNVTFIKSAKEKFGSSDLQLSVVVPFKKYEYAHPYAIKLIRNNNILCYSFKNEEDYTSIYKLSDELLEESFDKAIKAYNEFENSNIKLSLD